MTAPSVAELEVVAILAYREFHRAHEELFHKDAVEYWRQASIYKQDKMREYLKKLGGEKDGKLV